MILNLWDINAFPFEYNIFQNIFSIKSYYRIYYKSIQLLFMVKQKQIKCFYFKTVFNIAHKSYNGHREL